jgi:hypothetical protein
MLFTEMRLFRERGKLPFNSIIGAASTNVPAYSNGDEFYYSDQSNYLYGVYMGKPLWLNG